MPNHCNPEITTGTWEPLIGAELDLVQCHSVKMRNGPARAGANQKAERPCSCDLESLVSARLDSARMESGVHRENLRPSIDSLAVSAAKLGSYRAQSTANKVLEEAQQTPTRNLALLDEIERQRGVNSSG